MWYAEGGIRVWVENVLVAIAGAGAPTYESAQWAKSEIEDDPCLPAAVDLLDGDLVIGDGFDFGVDGMAGRIEKKGTDLNGIKLVLTIYLTIGYEALAVAFSSGDIALDVVSAHAVRNGRDDGG